MATKIVVSDKELEVGEVVWFHPQKFFGFVKPLNGGKDIFFHSNDEKWVKINENCDGMVFSVPDTNCTRSIPIPGQIIFFVRNIYGKGKTKASPWVSEWNLMPTSQDLDYANETCERCGHKMKDHDTSECMLCDCGHYDNWSPNDPDNYIEIKLPGGRTGVQVIDGLEQNLTGDPGGPTSCQ